MPEPLTAFAAKEAAIIASGLLTEGFQFGRRVYQAPEKARDFDSKTTTANDILRVAASSSSETAVLQPHIAALRTAVVAAQSKHEYELKKPKTGKISKTAVATSDTSINRLTSNLGGAVQGLGTSVGLQTLDVATQIHVLARDLPAAYLKLLQQHETQQRQWLERLFEERIQQMAQQFTLSQQQHMQSLFGSITQTIEQLMAALNDRLPRLEQITPARGLPPESDDEDAVFTFIADMSAALGSVVDVDAETLEFDFGSKSLPQEFIINRADRPDGPLDEDLVIVFSRWRPKDGLRRFEIHSRTRELLNFLPDYKGRETRQETYKRQLQNLAAALSWEMIPHSSQTGCLLLELGAVGCPLQVLCRMPTEDAVYYPPLCTFDGCVLPCYDESEITRLIGTAGWVYGVEINGDGPFLARKDVVDPSQVESFVAEVEALYSLQDVKNIAKIHGLVTSGAEGLVKGMLLEHLNPLASRIASDSGLDEKIYSPSALSTKYAKYASRFILDVEKVVKDILQIVVDVHEKGFVIGELVAEQFGLTSDNQVKLLGIKKRGSPLEFTPPEARKLPIDSLLQRFEVATREGIFDPASRRLSIKSDIWQLGALIIAMIMGWTDLWEILCACCEAKRNLEIGKRCPWPLRSILVACLKDDPAQRPSARQVLQSIHEAFDPDRDSKYSKFVYARCACVRDPDLADAMELETEDEEDIESCSSVDFTIEAWQRFYDSDSYTAPAREAKESLDDAATETAQRFVNASVIC
ncbi:hypothetical protein LTR56_003592 [Elasticomyces elasticus]|nr:hypothetical protein LTR56_003592 [Elasticomyces elasticus]KAK3663726.1 hypothetical protein LTR22_005427 [Elasticomyces elasticus]KAK4927244.1 hypothetical protein LTR49_005909 [Elasticomyces elasticus]KAK5767350.1 hypothetical protein LTS12_002503 [Elasticomyces elasticus]